jgi:hypothetical protein
MTRIDNLRNRIEMERLKLNAALGEKRSDLQACYAQNVLLDGLIEEYINELEKMNC